MCENTVFKINSRDHSINDYARVKVNDNKNENTIKPTIYLGCMFIKHSCTM